MKTPSLTLAALGAMTAALSSSVSLAAPLPNASRAGNVRIALIADPHVTLSTDPERRLYREHLDKVIADVNAAHVDLVLFAGDLTDGGRPEQLAVFQEAVKGFQAPVRWVPGNHDLGQKVGLLGKDGQPSTKGVVNARRIAAFTTALGPTYWSETIDGVRVVGINSPVLGSGLPIEAEQWTFLEKELTPKQHSDAPPTIVLTHYPLYTEKPDEPGGAYWNVEPAPRAHLLQLLDGDHSVRAVLSGHLHRPLSFQRGSLLLYSAPPVSFGLPPMKQPEGWTLVTVPRDAAVPVTVDFHAVCPPIPAP